MSTFLAVEGGAGLRNQVHATVASAPLEPQAASALLEQPTLSATLPILEDAPPPPRPRPAASEPPKTRVPEEPAAFLEDVPLPEVPIEGLVAIERPHVVPAALGRGGAPGLTRASSLHTVDPFGTE